MRAIRLNIWVIAVWFGFLGLASSIHAAESLPPIGQRKYIIDQGKPYAPVTIEKVGTAIENVFLKDPRITGLPPPVKAAPPPVVVQPKPRAAKLRFRRMLVAGHMTRPRVDFKREDLPLGPVEEPMRQDFFPKIFESLDDNEL